MAGASCSPIARSGTARSVSAGRGVYFCSRAFVPLLVASDDGYLVNTSSVNGFWAMLDPGDAAHRVQRGEVRGEGLLRGAARGLPAQRAAREGRGRDAGPHRHRHRHSTASPPTAAPSRAHATVRRGVPRQRAAHRRRRGHRHPRRGPGREVADPRRRRRRSARRRGARGAGAAYGPGGPSLGGSASPEVPGGRRPVRSAFRDRDVCGTIVRGPRTTTGRSR